MSGSSGPLQTNSPLLAVDLHVAQRVRLRRREMGMAPQRLADLIGMTYEQVHKYETGISRIAAARLHALAVALGTDVAFFFKHLESAPLGPGDQDLRRLVELMHDVQRITRPEHRQAVCAMARALADQSYRHPVEPP